MATAPQSRTDRKKAWEARLWRMAFLLTGSVEGAGHVVERVLMARPDLLSIEDPARVDRLVALHAKERSGRARAGRRRFSLRAYVRASGARRSLDRLASAPAVTLPEPASRVHELVLRLGHQPRLAWILNHVEQVDDVWMAKAMDCSKTAAGVHLASAEKTLIQAQLQVQSQLQPQAQSQLQAQAPPEATSGASRAPASAEHAAASAIEAGAASLRKAMDRIEPGPYLGAIRREARERRIGRIAAVVVAAALAALAIKVAYDLIRSLV